MARDQRGRWMWEIYVLLWAVFIALMGAGVFDPFRDAAWLTLGFGIGALIVASAMAALLERDAKRMKAPRAETSTRRHAAAQRAKAPPDRELAFRLGSWIRGRLG